MLALSGSGSICDFRIQQRVAIAWDPANNLCGSIGLNLRCLNSPTPPNTPNEICSPWDAAVAVETPAVAAEDIADIIHRRALNDYGKLVRS